MHEASEPRGPLAVDRTVMRFVVDHRAGWPATVARAVTHLGDPLALLGMAVVATILLARRSRSVLVGLPAVSLVVGSFAESTLKQVFRRPRPPVVDPEVHPG